MNEPNQQTISAEISPPVAMLQLIAGFWVSRAIYIAAKLGIADRYERISHLAFFSVSRR